MKKDIINKIKNLSKGSIIGTETEINLTKAFINESQAYQRYTLFSDLALEEGYENISIAFKQIAKNEKVHAQIFFSLLENETINITEKFQKSSIGLTNSNLIQSINNESYEHKILYPEFSRIAEKEQFNFISELFLKIANIEKHHEQIFSNIKNQLANDKLLTSLDQSIWICNECGHLHIGKSAPIECPTCHHPKFHYKYYSKL